jgi:hypothetical protein
MGIVSWSALFTLFPFAASISSFYCFNLIIRTKKVQRLEEEEEILSRLLENRRRERKE